MTEERAKQKLAEILVYYRPGTVLHFLGDLLGAAAAKVEGSDPGRAGQLRQGEAALLVFGVGIDSLVPW